MRAPYRLITLGLQQLIRQDIMASSLVDFEQQNCDSDFIMVRRQNIHAIFVVD